MPDEKGHSVPGLWLTTGQKGKEKKGKKIYKTEQFLSRGVVGRAIIE